jgi:hypothetical protein
MASRWQLIFYGFAYLLALAVGAEATAGAGATAAEAAGAAGSGAWVASEPCFSPLMSMSPPLLKINKAKPAKTAKPTTIFHINTPK